MLIRPAVTRRVVTRRRRGISLFQVLMGLALFAATLIGAVTLYNTATETQRVNEAQTLLTTLTVAVNRIYQGTSTYPTGMVRDLEARGAIPSSALVAGNPPTIRHPFGAAVTVTRRGGGVQYAITFEDLDDENCTQMIDPYIGQASGSGGLEEVEVGGTDVTLSSGGVRTACSNGAAANDVAFVFE